MHNIYLNILMFIINVILAMFGFLFSLLFMKSCIESIDNSIVGIIVGLSSAILYATLCLSAYGFSTRIKEKSGSIVGGKLYLVYAILVIWVVLTPFVVVKISAMPWWGNEKYGNSRNIDNVGFNGFEWGMGYDQFIHKKKMVLREKEYVSEIQEYPVVYKSFVGDNIAIGNLSVNNANYWFDNNAFARVIIVIPKGGFKKYKEQCFVLYGKSYNEYNRAFNFERYYWWHGDTFVQLSKDLFDGGQLKYESISVEKKTQHFYKERNL